MKATQGMSQANPGHHEIVLADFFAEATTVLMILPPVAVADTWICSTAAVEADVCSDPDRPSTLATSPGEGRLKSR